MGEVCSMSKASELFWTVYTWFGLVRDLWVLLVIGVGFLSAAVVGSADWFARIPLVTQVAVMIGTVLLTVFCLGHAIHAVRLWAGPDRSRARTHALASAVSVLSFAAIAVAVAFVVPNGLRGSSVVVGDMKVYTILSPLSGITHALIEVRVRNTGEPSVIDRWQLHVRPPGARDYITGVPVPMTSGIFVDIGTQESIHVRPDDELSRKVERTPLQKGAGESGYLFFRFETIGPHELGGFGTALHIEARDVRGRKVERKLELR